MLRIPTKGVVNLRATILTMLLLGAGAFSVCTMVEPWFQEWGGNRTRSANALAIALGDGRKVFARHVVAKADAYFHRGYYPSAFDTQPAKGNEHMSDRASGHSAGCDGENAHLNKPLDWLDAFSRKFYASEHTHMGEGRGHSECGHDHGDKAEHTCEHEHSEGCKHGEATGTGEERELLPWLKLAATLDPQQPDTYVVASFWLRTKLGKFEEAEKFLREGLRHNPSDPKLLFELGRIFSENRGDPERARNLWELALSRCEREKAETRDLLLHAQLLIHLAKVEYEAQRYDAAMAYINKLMEVSPNRAGLETWVRDLREAAAKSKP